MLPAHYNKKESSYFCRFTFGQFFTILVLEIFTLFFVFYLGARYGDELLSVKRVPQTAIAEESGFPKLAMTNPNVVATTQDPEIKALAKDLLEQAPTADLKQRVQEMLQESAAVPEKRVSGESLTDGGDSHSSTPKSSDSKGSNRNEKATDKYLKAVSEVRNLLHQVRNSPTVADSLRLLEPIYTTLESACQELEEAIPEKSKKDLDPRILEEILRGRLKAEPDTLTYDIIRDNSYSQYPEFNPEPNPKPNSGQESHSRVYEDIVPTRRNNFIQNLLEKNSEEVVSMREQLEKLVPPDVYIVRGKTRGRVDQRAVRKYMQDVEKGLVPSARVFYKKIVEKIVKVYELEKKITKADAKDIVKKLDDNYEEVKKVIKK